MGCVYQRKGTGFYWIKYFDQAGRPQYESSRSKEKRDAKDLLKLREGDITRGLPVTAKVGRLTFDEAARDLITDYQTNKQKSLSDLKRKVTLHLTPYFRDRRMAEITTVSVRAYIAARQEQEAGNAQINRELAILKRTYSLAIKAGLLLSKPHIPMLKEPPARSGFFEPEQFSAVLSHLPEPLRPMMTFAYITGWRVMSEVRPLQWRQVDFGAGRVRLDPGTTKNGQGRTFPMSVDLRDLLHDQRKATTALEKEYKRVIPHVFHRRGVEIRDFYHAWRTACRKAGCPGRIPHDFRRTAIRNLVRNGIAERVAMEFSGHLTRSVFERYNIVSEGDYEAAVVKMDAVPVPKAAKRLKLAQ